MENNLIKLRGLCQKEKDLTSICNEMKLNEYEVLSLVSVLRNEGINMTTKVKDDGIYLLDQGEREFSKENNYTLYTDEENEFKFVAISDTRFGSTSQQLSILNDIYDEAYKQGYKNVILCGNLTEGLVPTENIYSDSIFLDDTLRQVNYIIKYYPKVDGIKTYFITGTKDEKHLKVNKINVGKRISNLRNDMIYLGFNSCNLNIDKVKMQIFNPNLGKTYTSSYRPQQQIDSFRSEDKPDILLYGGLLQMEKFTYRNVKCISVPSVCATTEEMNNKRYSNTIGAWFITIKTDEKGYFESLKAIDSIYYSTIDNDYKKSRVLRINGGK